MVSAALLAGIGLLVWPTLLLIGGLGLRFVHLTRIRKSKLVVYSGGQLRKPGRIFPLSVVAAAKHQPARGGMAKPARR